MVPNSEHTTTKSPIFNQKKIDKHKEYIVGKSQEYLDQLEQNDIQENPVAIKNIQDKMERLKHNEIKYELLEKQLKASGEPQISTTDADARALLVQGQVVEISYKIQAAVDDKHNPQLYRKRQEINEHIFGTV